MFRRKYAADDSGLGFTPGDDPVEKTKSRNKVRIATMLPADFTAFIGKVLANVH